MGARQVSRRKPVKVSFSKYHALGNDFIVIEQSSHRIPGAKLSVLIRAVCDRHQGVGADGVVHLSASRKADRTFDIYNADGGWAEMSGNGLRIGALHLYRTMTKRKQRKQRKQIQLETAEAIRSVKIGAKRSNGYLISCDLGRPEFLTSRIPVRSRMKFIINQPIKVGSVSIPVTCLATGNPHCVLIVDRFDFDWLVLGARIESLSRFPNGTNVEFVKIISDSKIEVRLWERGVGETSSSGTGAAAAVAATTMMGITQRKCKVVSEAGQVDINWSAKTETITLTGPVSFVATGEFEYLG